jgi:murein DD-endopeptidase MepM/ murein hydrolase activator NlpD
VVFAGRNGGYGKMVMLEHADGRQTLYAHAERLFVKPGDVVAAGQTIAAVGSTGHSTGPHLHFEIREGQNAVNPLKSLIKDLTLARR